MMLSVMIKDRLERAESLLVRRLPARMLANQRILTEKYKTIYGNRDFTREVKAHQRRIARQYGMICLLTCALLAVLIPLQWKHAHTPLEIQRPLYGQTVKNIPADITVRSGKVKANTRAVIRAAPPMLTKEEKQERLKACAKRLPDIIRGENKSLSAVTQSIVLPETVDAVHITWSSDSPDILGKDGSIDNAGWKVNKERKVLLQAALSLEEADAKWQQEITVRANEEAEHVKRILKKRAQKAALAAGMAVKDKPDKQIVLPQTLGGGTEVIWRKAGTNYAMHIILAALLAVGLIYQSRYRRLDAALKAKREAVVSEFPSFVDKLVLLLGAGMVVSAALEKIPADYARYRQSGPPKAFHEELLLILQRVKGTNTSYIEELERLAARMGVRELSRAAIMIKENISKGAALAEKLEAEGELLRQSRRKRAQELGRLADTKLILPLVLLLGSLMAVTVTPAWMGM